MQNYGVNKVHYGLCENGEFSFFNQGPLGAIGPPGPPGVSGQMVSTYTLYCMCFLI